MLTAVCGNRNVPGARDNDFAVRLPPFGEAVSRRQNRLDASLGAGGRARISQMKRLLEGSTACTQMKCELRVCQREGAVSRPEAGVNTSNDRHDDLQMTSSPLSLGCYPGRAAGLLGSLSSLLVM